MALCTTESGSFFRVNTPTGPTLRCLRHTLGYPPLLRRSFITALVVGTILTAINQSGHLLRGEVSGSLVGRIALTYCVPFCVATWGAMVNSRVRVPAGEGRERQGRR